VSGSVVTVVSLPPASTVVREARLAVRHALTKVGASDLVDAAELATSELVTNAVVHAGSQVTLRITAEARAVRVEVGDTSRHLPVRRSWGAAAATGPAAGHCTRARAAGGRCEAGR
jgi:anti-sigma regulatory factor (Ser/Thr protein kinase)